MNSKLETTWSLNIKRRLSSQALNKKILRTYICCLMFLERETPIWPVRKTKMNILKRNKRWSHFNGMNLEKWWHQYHKQGDSKWGISGDVTVDTFVNTDNYSTCSCHLMWNKIWSQMKNKHARSLDLRRPPQYHWNAKYKYRLHNVWHGCLIL